MKTFEQQQAEAHAVARMIYEPGPESATAIGVIRDFFPDFAALVKAEVQAARGKEYNKKAERV